MGTVAPRGRSPRGQELGSMEAGASRSRAGVGRSRAGASSRQGKGALATTTPTVNVHIYIVCSTPYIGSCLVRTRTIHSVYYLCNTILTSP